MSSGLLAAIIAATISGLSAAVAPFLAKRLTEGQAAKALAEASLTTAQAEQTRFYTARDAAQVVAELIVKSQATADELHALRRRAWAIEQAGREHGEWDQQMVETVRTMRDQLRLLGVGDSIPIPPDPPPLIPPDESEPGR